MVLLIRVPSGADISAYDVVSGLFPDKQEDFVFNISENDTVLVKEIKRGIDQHDIEKLAASMVDTLNGCLLYTSCPPQTSVLNIRSPS